MAAPNWCPLEPSRGWALASAARWDLRATAFELSRVALASPSSSLPQYKTHERHNSTRTATYVSDIPRMYIVPYVCRSGKVKTQVGVLQTGDSGLAPTIVHSEFFALDLNHHRGGLKLGFKHTLLNLPAQALSSASSAARSASLAGSVSSPSLHSRLSFFHLFLEQCAFSIRRKPVQLSCTFVHFYALL